MNPGLEEETQAPEPFEIPELAEFYRFPFERKRGGEWVVRKLQRNDPCMCGSGRKQKKCCGEFDSHRYNQLVELINEELLKKEVENKDPVFARAESFYPSPPPIDTTHPRRAS